MQSDKEDKGTLHSSTNHTITETSRLANSTCSPRILHARVFSRGILEFLFLEKPSRLQCTAEYVFSSWCVLCGIKDQRINTLTFLLFHILPPHWSYLTRRHLRSTPGQLKDKVSHSANTCRRSHTDILRKLSIHNYLISTCMNC